MKTRLGKAIELVPGKSEQYLMLAFEDNCHLWLRGDDSQPVVYIEAAIWGNEGHLGYDEFTAEVTRIFHGRAGHQARLHLYPLHRHTRLGRGRNKF